MATTIGRLRVGSQVGRRKLVVVGQGYVGLPLALRGIEVGYEVVGFDTNIKRVETLLSGESGIPDISDRALKQALASGCYRPTFSTKDLNQFEVAVIAVPTPLSEGVPDTRAVEAAAYALGLYLEPGSVVVLESTTYPGTTEQLLAPILEKVSGMTAGRDFFLGYSPERIDPGNSTWSLRTIPKIVSGINEESLSAVKSFYEELVEEVVPTAGTREAEFAKLLENTYRYVNIALINELAISARSMRVDIWDVIAAASTKPFGYTPFYPGPGVGGHCLPVDPTYLGWQLERELGAGSRFIDVANDVNRSMPIYVLRRLQDGLNERGLAMKGAKILVVGLAYKANTNDSRESPAIPIIAQLRTFGAVVNVHDAIAESVDLGEGIKNIELSPESLADHDVVLILTNHDGLALDMISEHARYIFDTRNCLTGDNVEVL